MRYLLVIGLFLLPSVVTAGPYAALAARRSASPVTYGSIATQEPRCSIWVPTGDGPLWTDNRGDSISSLTAHLQDTHGFPVSQVEGRSRQELVELHSDVHNGLDFQAYCPPGST